MRATKPPMIVSSVVKLRRNLSTSRFCERLLQRALQVFGNRSRSRYVGSNHSTTLVEYLPKSHRDFAQLREALILQQDPKKAGRCFSHASARDQLLENFSFLIVGDGRISEDFF